MANVPGMTRGGREASVPTGYKTAYLLGDSWYEHVCSLFLSSLPLALPILLASGLDAKAFIYSHVVYTTLFRSVSPSSVIPELGDTDRKSVV